MASGIGRLSFGIRSDPRFIGLHERLQEFPCPVIGDLAVGIEQLVGAPDIGFGLRYRRNIQEDKRLPQMMVGAEPADAAWRGTDDCTRLTAPCALAIVGASRYRSRSSRLAPSGYARA
jgi:hypothetical protein